jgi:hypothetical protein
MPKANRVLSTPRRTASEMIQSTESWRAYSDLESPISDAALMAGVNSTLMEDVAGYTAKPASKFRPGYSIVRDQDIDQLVFCAYHLEQMIVALKKQYFAATEGNR